MPKFNLVRSTIINVPAQQVFKSLENLGEWPKWSPWLIMNPNANVMVKNEGQAYEWEGDRVGNGHMEVVSSIPNQELIYNLTFLKPWKSTSRVKMILTPVNDGTKVSWHMESRLPFFMFWMKKMMTAYIGNDYERGLRMLKDLLEKGKVESQLNFIGERKYPGCKYVGINRSCNTSDIATLMEEDFTKLMAFGMKNGLDSTKAFSQYHKWDFVKGMATYTAGLPYSTLPDNLPLDFVLGEIPPCKIYTLEHKGRYDHIGNAWSTIHAISRNKEFKINKKIHPFETYGNSPRDTKPENLLASINFPIK